jgi:Protein of unknown function (DUF3179)
VDDVGGWVGKQGPELLVGLQMMNKMRGAVTVVSAAMALSGCGDGGGLTDPGGNDLCSLNQNLLFSSLPPDAIPALTLPEMVDADDGNAAYLFDFDRVLGVVVEGEARAYPHNILWHHEIVNDKIGDTWITVTLCPLTGSGLAYDPHVGGKRLDIGVSGLLFANNLVFYDRLSGAVYGPQLSVEGKCSTFRNESLTLKPVQEMSWGRWKELHPDTKVVTGATGFPRNYRAYPYGSYDQINNGELLFPMDVDRTRPIKERVLAIRIGEGGKGYPFGELQKLGSTVALNEVVGSTPTAIFYEDRDGEAAIAFDARVGGQTLTFDVGDGGMFVDRETGSTWAIDGAAVSGPMAGERLQTRADAFVVFWFAWRHFQPDGEMFAS